MPDHLRPSAVPRRRAVMLALLLLVLAALGAAITVRAQTTIDPQRNPPGGWMPAEHIVDNRCVPVAPGAQRCRTVAVRDDGLFRLPSKSPSVGRSYVRGQTQKPPDAPLAGPRYDRDACAPEGVFMFHPRGIWNYGARWSRPTIYSYTEAPNQDQTIPPHLREYILTISYGDWKMTSGPNYAFESHDDCALAVSYLTETRTALARPTGTPPPGTGITVTPTDPVNPPPTPTPTPTATATPRPCIPVPIDPVPLTLFAGTTDHYNNNGQPFTRYGADTCRVLGDSRYCDTNGWRFSGADGSKYYDGAAWGQMLHGDLTDLNGMAQVRDLWTEVPANVVVEARYHFEFGRRMFDASNVDRSRNAMVILQDLGSDMQPGGGDDRLLAFLAMGDADLQDSKRHLKVQGTSRDSWPRLNLPGRPSGWQALLAPGVQVWSNAFFSWQGNRTPPYAWQSWPQPEQRDANGNLTRHAQDWLYTNDGGTNHGPLRLRFITERGRAYRMVMLNSVPGCNADMLHNISQLYFFTDRGANVAVEKQAPERASRNQMVGYSLTVRNTSQKTANNVVLTDTLPVGMPFGEADLVLRDPNTGAETTTRVAATSSVAPTWTDGRTLVWNLGDLVTGEVRTINLTVPATDAAPDAATNVAVVSAANDGDPNDNRAEATTVFVRTNVRVRITTPRIVRPGQEFETVISYENTSPEDATNVLLDYQVVPNVTIVGATPGHQEMNNERPVWRLGTVAAGQRGTVRVRVQVPPADSPALPVAVLHLARISADADADPMDNAAQATTTVLVVPPPQRGEERLRIHSEFDPERGVYLSEGTTVTWPAGEVMDFTPFIAPDNRQVGLPYYRLDRKIVAWSFVGTGNLNLIGATCKAREEPTAEDVQHADLSRLKGCIYRYHVSPSSAQMRWQGHLFWGQYAPERMRQDVYVRTPLPTGGTDLRIQYAVLTEAVETGYEDVDGDGRTDSVLERRTDVFEATYRVELVVPRDAR